MMRFAQNLLVSSLLCLLAASAQAQVLIDLSPSTPQTITPGETIDFSGTVTNTGADVFVNGDELTLSPPNFLFTFDDTPILTSSQLFPLPAGGTYTGPLFSITAPNGIINGSFDGTLTLLGGADTFTTDSLGSAAFRINAVPEPGAFALLAGGGVALSGALLRRRKR
jgi:hypothetical protein